MKMEHQDRWPKYAREWMDFTAAEISVFIENRHMWKGTSLETPRPLDGQKARTLRVQCIRLVEELDEEIARQDDV